MKCSICGSELKPGVITCPFCGNENKPEKIDDIASTKIYNSKPKPRDYTSRRVSEPIEDDEYEVREYTVQRGGGRPRESFCSKCGRPLDGITRKCVVCDAAEVSRDGYRRVKAPESDPARSTANRKKKNKAGKIALIIAGLLVLFTVTCVIFFKLLGGSFSSEDDAAATEAVVTETATETVTERATEKATEKPTAKATEKANGRQTERPEDNSAHVTVTQRPANTPAPTAAPKPTAVPKPTEEPEEDSAELY